MYNLRDFFIVYSQQLQLQCTESELTLFPPQVSILRENTTLKLHDKVFPFSLINPYFHDYVTRGLQEMFHL